MKDWNCALGPYNSSETFEVLFGETCLEKEDHVFENACLTDLPIGAVCLVISFILMFGSLAGVVKCLKAALEGSISITGLKFPVEFSVAKIKKKKTKLIQT